MYQKKKDLFLLNTRTFYDNRKANLSRQPNITLTTRCPVKSPRNQLHTLMHETREFPRSVRVFLYFPEHKAGVIKSDTFHRVAEESVAARRERSVNCKI